jgi:hypothetical protein
MNVSIVSIRNIRNGKTWSYLRPDLCQETRYRNHPENREAYQLKFVGDTNTEEWKKVNGYDDYEISNHGRARSFRGKITKGPGNGPGTKRARMEIPVLMKPSMGKNGYYSVNVIDRIGNQKACYIHRLVMDAFVGPCPSGYVVCHAPDPDKNNNHIGNLRYDTRRENSRDYLRVDDGRKNKIKKLSECEILDIRDRLSRGESGKKIATLYSITPTSVSAIKNRKTWSHLS